MIMAIRNLAKAGAQKHELEEAAAKKAAEEASQNRKTGKEKNVNCGAGASCGKSG